MKFQEDIEQAKIFAGFFLRDDLGKVAAAQCLHRRLYDFTVDMGNSIRLRNMAPADTVFVSESGIKTAEDIRILYENKVDAVLIGETLMRSPDKKAALGALNAGIV